MKEIEKIEGKKQFTEENETEKQKLQFVKMTEYPVLKLILSLSVPTVISMLVSALYNISDTFFVSQLGTSASAAVGVVFSLMSIIQAIGFGLGMGSGNIISRCLGRHDYKASTIFASSAFFASILCGTLITVVGLLTLNPFMRLLGSTETILPYSSVYAIYILIGSPFMCASFVLNNVLRAEGKAFYSMIGIGVGCVLNIGLDPLLIFVFNLGISGAAIATLIGQIISFCLLGLFFISKKSIVPISVKKISFDIKIYQKIIKTGIPTVFRQGLASFASALLNIKAAVFGDAAIAGVTIAMKIYLFIRNIVLGIGQGFQPAAGYNYGAGKYERVKKLFKVTVLIGTIICVISSILIFFNSNWLMNAFRKGDNEVIEIGVHTLYWFCIALPFLGYSTYVNQMMQCLGASFRATFLASCRQGIFYLPLIILLSALFGLQGIEATQAIADLLTFVISIPFQIIFFKRTLNKHDLENVA